MNLQTLFRQGAGPLAWIMTFSASMFGDNVPLPQTWLGVASPASPAQSWDSLIIKSEWCIESSTFAWPLADPMPPALPGIIWEDFCLSVWTTRPLFDPCKLCSTASRKAAHSGKAHQPPGAPGWHMRPPKCIFPHLHTIKSLKNQIPSSLGVSLMGESFHPCRHDAVNGTPPATQGFFFHPADKFELSSPEVYAASSLLVLISEFVILAPVCISITKRSMADLLYPPSNDLARLEVVCVAVGCYGRCCQMVAALCV